MTNPTSPFRIIGIFLAAMSKRERHREEALVREVKEEIAVELKQWVFFRRYVCTEGDAYPNIKYLYWARIDKLAEELTLYEGQRLEVIAAEERTELRFANILGQVLEDFVRSGLWPRPVDNFSRRFKKD